MTFVSVYFSIRCVEYQSAEELTAFHLEYSIVVLVIDVADRIIVIIFTNSVAGTVSRGG